jgi:hypothetical protein
MSIKTNVLIALLASAIAAVAVSLPAVAQQQQNTAANNDYTKYKSYGSKPNIVTIISRTTPATGTWERTSEARREAWILLTSIRWPATA